MLKFLNDWHYSTCIVYMSPSNSIRLILTYKMETLNCLTKKNICKLMV